MSLYNELRPQTLDAVVAQPAAVSALKGFLAQGNVPHAILFSGPPGCGKTTLARIMAKEVGAKGMDIIEKNFAQDRGIDTVRDIESNMSLSPMLGKSKVYILDEAHSMTPAAGQSMLKMLEDTPKHVYFFLCTSEPTKLAKALLTRLTPIKVAAISKQDIEKYLRSVDADLTEKLARRIADAAGGAMRSALVLLEQVKAAGYDASVVDSATSGEISPEQIDLVKAICLGSRGKDWGTVYSVLNATEDDALESLRHFVLAYAKAMFKNLGNGDRMAKLVDNFGSPFFNSKKSGFLAAAWRSMPS
jgi:DNA polymerase III gamma/tau subunit